MLLYSKNIAKYMSSLKKISLKDIAEAAGVSTALVSFVLNGKKKEYRVGEETAQRILKIANEMNYQPNLAAKSLRSGKTETIGLVVSDISNPFFSKMRLLSEIIQCFLEARMKTRIKWIVLLVVLLIKA